MTIVLSILNALAAIPSIFSYVESFAATVMTWYINNAKNADFKAIADASNLQASAKSVDDRLAASDAWQAALAKSRYVP